ncbi:MAG: hypothetical protein EA371_04800 [Gammaproteobacteria bacterium]|nr:MAG: hypothetical protein EA371_04800 [Gammaproteobacteria bacterium]
MREEAAEMETSATPRSGKGPVIAALATAVALLLGAGPGGFSPVASAVAQEEETRQVQALRERVFQGLSGAQERLEEEDYAGARRELDRIRTIQDLNSYERGQILYFTGLIDYQQENLTAAVRAFEQVVALPDLPQGFMNDTLWTLVQLAMATEQYEKALEYGNRWLASAQNPGGDPFYLLAVAHYQLEQYRQSVEYLNRAIEIAERDRDGGAREEWYGLLRAGYFQLEDTARLREVLELLVTRWPKKEYWTHLSAVYGELGMQRRQVAVLEAIYEEGLMDRENEIVQLAQLYLQSGGPYKGARILERGMADGIVERNERNYRLLSQAWMMSQDDRRAIPPLQEAARRSGDGQLYLQLAQSHLNLDQHEQCVEAARAGLNRGGLRRPDTANVVLGMCLYELQQYEPAKTAFRAARSDDRSRRTANQWIEFIEREVSRRQDLQRQLARS